MIALEGDCYPQSPIYGETLAHCTRAVYPLDFPDGIAAVGWCIPLALVRSYVYGKQRF
jgi:hypothetical protein